MEAVRRGLAGLVSFGLAVSPVAAQVKVVLPAVVRPVVPVVVPQAPALGSDALPGLPALPTAAAPSLPAPAAPSARLLAGADFTPAELASVKAVSDSLERAVAAAAASAIPGAAMSVRSRGSSSRATHVDADPDYDVMVRVDAGRAPEDAAALISGSLAALKAALVEAVGRSAAARYPGVDLKVSVGGPVQLFDPADRRRVEGVFMLPVAVIGPSGVLLDSDVTFTARPDYANAYPEHFGAQLAELEAKGVPTAEVLSDIRLAKRFFKGLLGSYKPWQGGPSGVGVEQMVLQAGGTFDGMMDKVFEAAYRPDGMPRGLKQARRVWNVENRFMAPANFLDLFGDKAWGKTAHAARAYREAKAAGRIPTLSQLRQPDPPPPPARAGAAKREVPVTRVPAALAVSLEMRTGMKQVRALETMRWAVRRLKQSGWPVEDHAAVWRRADGRNAYTLTVRLAADADAAAARAQLEALLRGVDAKASFGDAAAGALQLPDAWAVVAARGEAAAEKLANKLAARLRVARGKVEPRPGGLYALGLRLRGRPAAEFASDVRGFFAERGGTELRGLVLADGGGVPAAAAEPAGTLTLGLLDRFTTHGPAPAARGDAYLYAQGAKALPAGLEGPRPAGALKAGDPVVRTKLFRRGGRAYVMLDDPEAEGPNASRPVKVPARFAQGVVTDTLVEVSHQGKLVTGLRPIGAYAADVVIGRVVKVGDALRLGPLFTGDPAKALYEPLPLTEAAREGDLLQAFVRPTAGGYEAVPLVALGRELTPELAAREIALRHGARGYFERAVIAQAEAVGRAHDPQREFERMKASKGRAEDLRALPFVTIDPVGAGDLDDAYFVRREADGSWTWFLATADVAQYVRPGTPAFRAAARIGNTFYSPDKDGVPEYPMNHPVVSKSVSSLLAGKDSLAMVTKMRFSPEGRFLLEDSEVYLGLVRVQGRYTYDQVTALWKGAPDHGVAHLEQVALARELAGLLGRADDARGKLALSFAETRHVPGPGGRWRTEAVEEEPLTKESHRLIEELKVYGNRVIATRLEAVAAAAGVPHVSRIHPRQDEEVDERLRRELSALGAPWRKDETLWSWLARLKADRAVRPEVRETAQLLALMSRASARYAAGDAEGHEGLALAAKAYDHPSTPIRRFSDMYNRALLEAYLEDGDAKAVHEAVLADLKALGFAGFAEYLEHLNGREQAARRMDREFDAFMSVYELARPEHAGRTFTGYVKILKEGRNAEAVVQLRELPVSVTLQGEAARRFKRLDEVSVTVRSADVSAQSVDAVVRRR